MLRLLPWRLWLRMSRVVVRRGLLILKIPFRGVTLCLRMLKLSCWSLLGSLLSL